MSSADRQAEPYVHNVSVVVPVYQGMLTLTTLMKEIEPLTRHSSTPAGHHFRVGEVLLVFDNGPDGSAQVMRALADEFDFVRPVWLSRNFGQHAATLAGMASTGGGWIVTMDEDGQHDPAYIGPFLDVALAQNAQLVYARPTNQAPHGMLRNRASATTKWLFTHLLSSGQVTEFQSYRLVLGEIGRSVAAYAGPGVFLDVAIGWVSGPAQTCDIELRSEGGRPSGYSYRRLLSHFWRMVLSSGTKGLRMVSVAGVVLALLGVVLAVVLVVVRLSSSTDVAGWTSVIVAILLTAGAVLFALGIIAEYVGVAVNMAMGKPLYLIVSDPIDGPLGARDGQHL